MTDYSWLPEDERGFFEIIVHGLRMRGWTRFDAESEALDRLQVLRNHRRDGASPITSQHTTAS